MCASALAFLRISLPNRMDVYFVALGQLYAALGTSEITVLRNPAFCSARCIPLATPGVKTACWLGVGKFSFSNEVMSSGCVHQMCSIVERLLFSSTRQLFCWRFRPKGNPRDRLNNEHSVWCQNRPEHSRGGTYLRNQEDPFSLKYYSITLY